MREYPDRLPDDAEARLMAIAEPSFRDTGIPKAALALWRPRFLRAAHWFVEQERGRRAGIARSFVEIRGRRSFAGPYGEFVLRGRADRIDMLRDGGGAIIDYKTGDLPSKKQVRALLSPQLPLEGAILAEGGFEGIGKLAPARARLYPFRRRRRPGRSPDLRRRDGGAGGPGLRAS